MSKEKIMSEQLTKKEQIETLLPWYVTGKLSAAERQKVDQYIATNSDKALQLELIQQERLETVLQNEATGLPTSGGIDRLMTRLDIDFGPDKSNSESNWLNTIWADITSAFQKPAMQFAGIAAALVIVLQSVSLGVLVQNNAPGSKFTTASGPITTRTGGITMLVTFTPQATAGQISKLLEETGGAIVNGPLAGEFYHIRFPITATSLEEIKTLTNRLEGEKNIIAFVSLNE